MVKGWRGDLKSGVVRKFNSSWQTGGVSTTKTKRRYTKRDRGIKINEP